jgi:hypothetical protein
MALAYVAVKRKAPLSILHLNMESWSFPSNLNEAKDASLNNPRQLRYAEPSFFDFQ